MNLKDVIFGGGGAAAGIASIVKIWRDYRAPIVAAREGDKIKPFSSPEARATRRELDERLRALGIQPADDSRPR